MGNQRRKRMYDIDSSTYQDGLFRGMKKEWKYNGKKSYLSRKK